jgi:hypothetical protein
MVVQVVYPGDEVARLRDRNRLKRETTLARQGLVSIVGEQLALVAPAHHLAAQRERGKKISLGAVGAKDDFRGLTSASEWVGHNDRSTKVTTSC